MTEQQLLILFLGLVVGIPLGRLIGFAILVAIENYKHRKWVKDYEARESTLYVQAVGRAKRQPHDS